ncbi:hypothetical protein CRENBAI_001669 [Crenichthys baileyi]|uniref:Uncharacterized protein n=1 Tax=Crenichthys baileyi TaxID=28760 RepID=A0AAV9S390_9TELE
MRGRTPEARSSQGGRRWPRKEGKNQNQNNPTRTGGGARVQAAGPEAVPGRSGDQQADNVGAGNQQAGDVGAETTGTFGEAVEICGGAAEAQQVE